MIMIMGRILYAKCTKTTFFALSYIQYNINFIKIQYGGKKFCLESIFSEQAPIHLR